MAARAAGSEGVTCPPRCLETTARDAHRNRETSKAAAQRRVSGHHSESRSSTGTTASCSDFLKRSRSRTPRALISAGRTGRAPPGHLQGAASGSGSTLCAGSADVQLMVARRCTAVLVSPGGKTGTWRSSSITRRTALRPAIGGTRATMMLASRTAQMVDLPGRPPVRAHSTGVRLPCQLNSAIGPTETTPGGSAAERFRLIYGLRSSPKKFAACRASTRRTPRLRSRR
jgi:hypothetical protein